MNQLPRARRLSLEQRAEIQASRETVRALAHRLGINPKSVQRWRPRNSPIEQSPGRRIIGSSVLSAEEEAIVIAFRQTTQLALDDCLYALQPTIPHLRRSTLHRCLKRHGLSRLALSAAPSRVHGTMGLGQIALVISPAPTEEGMFYMFGATDRLARFAYARLYASDRAQDAVAFLLALGAALPYRLTAIQTDDSLAFAWPSEKSAVKAARARHPFATACDALGVAHNIRPRSLTVQAPMILHRFKYVNRQDLQSRLTDFLIAVNYSQRLKTLGGMTPFDKINQLWRTAPEAFDRAPSRLRPSDFETCAP